MFALFCLWSFVSAAEPTLKRAQAIAYAQDSANYHGQTYNLGAAVTLDPTWEVAASADALTRTYDGGSRVEDALFNLGAVWKPQSPAYVLADVYKSTRSDIYARNAVSVAPHYTSGASDFGLAIRYNDYRRLRAGSISPSYFHSLSDTTGFGAAAFVVRTEKFIAAVQAQALLNPFVRHQFRVIGATGRALEDAGLEVRFDSVTLEYAYALGMRWHLQLSYTDYASDVRREHSYGIGVGWR